MYTYLTYFTLRRLYGSRVKEQLGYTQDIRALIPEPLLLRIEVAEGLKA